MTPLYLWLAHPTPPTLEIGAGVALLGLLLRAVAASHLNKHHALVTSGPYAWTRHPLYLGSALLGAGFLVAIAGNILTMPGLPAAPAALSIDVDVDGKITGIF